MNVSETPPPASASEALAQSFDTMKALIEVVAGYRALCEQLGFSPTIAEVMAHEYHQMLVAVISR